MSAIAIGLSPDFLSPEGVELVDRREFRVPGFEDRATFERMPDRVREYQPGQLASYDAVLSLVPRVAAASLEGADRLCAVGRCGVGYDNVDLDACTAADVAVYITPNAVARPMGESIVLFVLAVSHRLVAKDRLVRQGCWAESQTPFGKEPRGRVIGSIGFGRIAREALRLLRVFDPGEILVHDPYCPDDAVREAGAEPLALEELLRRSDYVLVNCPLTPETRGLINRDTLALMKPTACLINTARGPIVDEDALADALEAGRLGGAALDVFGVEPMTDPEHRLLQLDNVIATSHSIGWTEELFRDMVREGCAGVGAIARGEAPPNVVNRDVLTRPGFRAKLRAAAERAGSAR